MIPKETLAKIEQAIVAALGDKEVGVQVEAARTASRLAGSPAVRDALIGRLSGAPPTMVVPHLLESLIRWLYDAETRGRILRELAGFEPARAARVLRSEDLQQFLRAIGALAGEDRKVRAMLCNWLDAATLDHGDHGEARPQGTIIADILLSQAIDDNLGSLLFKFCCGYPCSPLREKVFNGLRERVEDNNTLREYMLAVAVMGKTREERVRAIHVLKGAFHLARVRDVLTEALDDPEWTVVAAAISVLAPHLEHGESLRARVLELAGPGPGGTRMAAVPALSPYLHLPEVADAILGATAFDYGALRSVALIALRTGLDCASARAAQQGGSHAP